MKYKYIAIVPTYEPDENLIDVVTNLKKENFYVIVVNDGNKKKYDKYFEKCNPSKLISYKENKGKGYAIKTALKYIKDNYDSYIIVTIDSDGQHKVNDAIKLCKYVENHPNEYILGKRIRNKKVPLRSKIGNEITKTVFNIVSNQKIYDTQTGLRAFSNKLINYMINQKGNRFEYEMNTLLNAKNNDIKLTEIEIETIYINHNRSSHFNTIKDSYKIYKNIFKYTLPYIISFIFEMIFFILLIKNNISYNYSCILSTLLYLVLIIIVDKKIVMNNKIIKYLLYILSTICLDLLIFIILSNYINIYVTKILTELIMLLLINQIKDNIF